MNALSEQQQSALAAHFQQHYRKTDKLMAWFYWAHFALGLLFAPYYGTWGLAISLGAVWMGAYYLVTWAFPGTVLSRYVISALLWGFGAQFIIQMHGLAEMHFLFFTSAAVLVYYQDWKTLIPMALIAAVHHISLLVLGLNGQVDMSRYLLAGEITVASMGIHLTLVTLMGVICGLSAHFMRQQTIVAQTNLLESTERLDVLQTHADFAIRMSEGELQVAHEHKQDDVLGTALEKMRRNLVEAQEKEFKERFINSGLAEAGDILRQQGQDTSELADAILRYLIRYTESNQGGLFIRQEDETESWMELAACYAYGRKKFLEKRIDPKQGLVGQVWLEKAPIFMTDIPQGYTKITSGLGDGTPGCLYLLPLMSNEEVIGVLEIAAFTPLADYKLEFLNRLGESLASYIQTTKVNARTRQLLEESQMMGEQLRAQEEEMRQNLEELMATQEELQRRVAEFEGRAVPAWQQQAA